MRVMRTAGTLAQCASCARTRNTHYDAASRYAKLFAELGAVSLAVGVVLVVLIPFLRKLITDKAETPLVEVPTAAGPAAAAV